MYDIYDNFIDEIGVDVKAFLSDFVDFTNEGESFIYSYFSGLSTSIDSKYFEQLYDLIKRCNIIEELFTLNKLRFNLTSQWEVVDTINDVKIKLDTVNNMAKWCRSSRTPIGFNSIELSYAQRQNENLESLANRSGFLDPENDWVEIALKNSLKEEDYNREGGVLIKVNLQNDNKVILNTVVDVLSGEKVYGLDIYKKIEFEDDDLLTLSYKDTLNQSANILLNLVKGSVPEFPNDGVDKYILSSMTKTMNVLPSIIRQLYNTFKNDDTFSSISIVDVKRVDDSVSIDVLITSKLGGMIKENLLV